MTFQTTVKDGDGKPIPGLLVTANNEITGESFSRSTDGSGYADVAMLGKSMVGDRVTFSVLDPEYRFKGKVQGDALVITDANQVIEVTLVPFEKASVLPPVPTRAQVCALKTSLQGLTYHTAEFGDIPAWFYAMLTPTDRAQARSDHRSTGDTHITIPIAEAYQEPGTLWPEALKAGYDYTQNLDALRAICTEVIAAGFFVDMPLAGDGIGDGPGYNDPVGRTYGFGWLMNNLARIVTHLKGDGVTIPDLTPYIIFRPGWDGVFYGWGVPGEIPDLQPTRVKQFGELFRSLLPGGYLAIEHTPGNIPCGEGGADFAPGGLMRAYDTILSEFTTVHEDSCWQVVARMVPHYNRPSDQPSGDDPNPPFYLAPGTERGPYFYVAFEPTIGGVYQWCRGWCSLEDVNTVRAYLRGLGCALTG